MNISILYEDDDLLVVDKPSGIVVNRAKSVKGETMQDWAEKKLAIDHSSTDSESDLMKLFLDRSGICHRLDKDTSGCLLVAKNPRSLEVLLTQFKDRVVKKRYTTLVFGNVSPDTGTIKAPIGRIPWRHGFFGVMPRGKHAVTHYKRLSLYKFDNDQYSLLSVTIETGRTHQIRVHLQYINHPVVGDMFYAGRKRSRKVAVWCPRLFLHSSFVSFKHPRTGKLLSVECPLPAELSDVLDKLVKTT